MATNRTAKTTDLSTISTTSMIKSKLLHRQNNTVAKIKHKDKVVRNIFHRKFLSEMLKNIPVAPRKRVSNKVLKVMLNKCFRAKRQKHKIISAWGVANSFKSIKNSRV